MDSNPFDFDYYTHPVKCVCCGAMIPYDESIYTRTIDQDSLCIECAECAEVYRCEYCGEVYEELKECPACGYERSNVEQGQTLYLVISIYVVVIRPCDNHGI